MRVRYRGCGCAGGHAAVQGVASLEGLAGAGSDLVATHVHADIVHFVLHLRHHARERLETVFVHADELAHRRMRQEFGAAVDHRRQATGDGPLQSAGQVTCAGDHFAVAAKATRYRCVIGAFQRGGHLKIEAQALSHADHAPSRVVVDHGHHS